VADTEVRRRGAQGQPRVTDRPRASTSSRASPPSSIDVAEDRVLRATDAVLIVAEQVLTMPDESASRWARGGVSARGARWFNVVSSGVVVLLTVGWIWVIVDGRRREAEGESPRASATSVLASALEGPPLASPVYLTEAAIGLAPLRGRSGKLRATIQDPGARVEGGDELAMAADTALPTGPLAAPRRSGVWQVAVRVGNALKPVTDFSVITRTPLSAKRRGRIGPYAIGNFPTEGGRVRRGYSTPSGFIEVTRENQHTHISEHFRLRDFLTHDQVNVWPKYLVIETRLVDKLELVLLELERRGVRPRGVRVMSGFRTPQYNQRGGNPRGRAALSRHMYGDAADIFIDNDGNGIMDDLNRDGRLNIGDARAILSALDQVERENPALVGGAGVYPATGAHGAFIHIDTRGYRARWVGSGDGG